jgi:menaquinone-specific isochorismate synthase
MTRVAVARGARLVARSRPVEHRRDLLGALGPGGFAWLDGNAGFVTSGVAAAVAPEGAQAALDAIVHDAAPGTPPGAGPRAVGALPFAGGGRLVVPARIVGITADGGGWETLVGAAPADAPAAVPVAAAPAAPSPSRFVVSRATTPDEWRAAVRGALDAIAAGSIAKVVLSRAVDVEADARFDVRAVLAALHAARPAGVVYADGDFVGASPELLVARHGDHVTARPMAGTGDDADRLLASAKDAWEHRLVVDAVATGLRAAACTGIEADGPHAVRCATVTHLATTVTARASGTSALALARALHPTPAVAGVPTAGALALIARWERVDRGRYAGPCGWVDARGDGEFVVALRCAQLDGRRARLHAGAGIVAGSDPDREWSETQAKLETTLRALVRP